MFGNVITDFDADARGLAQVSCRGSMPGIDPRLKDGSVRIRGHIGDWPVDLSIELEPHEWAHLGRQLQEAPAVAQAVPATAAAPVCQDDGQWSAACALLRQAGQLSGPELLERLEGLTGSVAAGKRLLVRLRHSSEVKVDSTADAPLYRWVG